MTNTLPVVSVIITTYNREKTLGAAIESVLKQSYSNIELIIVNNGSTDGTISVIEFYAKNHKINYIYHEEHGRYFYFLNKWISLAKGKYINILDDDDFWPDKNKIKKQVNFLEENPDYILVGGGLIGVDQNGQEIARYLLPEKDADIKKTILISDTLAHTTVLFRKDAWEKSGGYDDKGIDWGFWLKMGKLGKFYNMQNFFTVYRGHVPGVDPGFVEKNYTSSEWLKINLKIKKKYKNDYPGYWRAVLFCWIRYFYSFLPFRMPPKRQMWSLMFKVKNFIYKLKSKIINK